MTTLCIVQARSGSLRLPQKVFSDLEGTPMVIEVLQRASIADQVDRVVLATTRSSDDDELASLARRYGFEVIRGPVHDVLERYALAAEVHPEAETIVRLTADCPLLDPSVIDDVVALHSRTGADYTSNRLPPPLGRTYPVGLDVEVFKRVALMRARREAKELHEREHVTPYLYSGGRFTVEIMNLPQDLSHHRWTVDTEADLEVVRAIFRQLPAGDMSWQSALAVVEANPAIAHLNATVRQTSFLDNDPRAAPREP